MEDPDERETRYVHKHEERTEAIPVPENFEYVSEDPTSVSLSWQPLQKMDPSSYNFTVILYKNAEETQSATVKSAVTTTVMRNLLPATEYKAELNIKLNNGQLSEAAVLIIYTKPLPPENLQIKKIGATTVCLTWTNPNTDDRIKHRIEVICIGSNESTPVKITQCTNINIESVLMELGLHSHLRDKLTLNFRNSLVAEAYSKLCAKFNTWEWAFKKHMIDWYTKSENKISNTGALSVQSMDALNIDCTLVDLKYEFADELDKEEKIIFDQIQQYFESEEEHVHLVENHKEDFLNSARGLRREIETDLSNKLENAVLIQKGTEKVEQIKQQQRDTMKTKVHSLISDFRNRRNNLSESELNEEFKKLWDDIVKKYSFSALPRQDMVKEIYRLLHNNLEMKVHPVKLVEMTMLNILPLHIGRKAFVTTAGNQVKN
ncbi:hypothetical protein Q8A67_015782 [Cirrhinus molitorella]|uniref:Fibronectin type-III domain-containing protein n=1 Tax=Cirrhinus molitorella TaxID=172907 RepID=A0AA88TJ53_9TELE|nr:hypothetical protein Q8A67_015782 [Cirrhinus molitorella]